jgi:hypothetical protein
MSHKNTELTLRGGFVSYFFLLHLILLGSLALAPSHAAAGNCTGQYKNRGILGGFIILCSTENPQVQTKVYDDSTGALLSSGDVRVGICSGPGDDQCSAAYPEKLAGHVNLHYL